MRPIVAGALFLQCSICIAMFCPPDPAGGCGQALLTCIEQCGLDRLSILLT
jgi:hypothetical protein